jgi:membrane protein
VKLIIVRKTIISVIENRLTGLASEIAFHSMLALFPGILAVFTALGLFADLLKDNLLYLMFELKSIIPEEAGRILLNFIQEIKVTNRSWFSLSFLVSFWVASGGMRARMNVLEIIHQVSPRQQRGFLQKQLISLVLTLATFILVLSASFFVLISDFIISLAIRQNWGILLLVCWQIISGLLLLSILSVALVILHKIRNFRIIQKFFAISLVVLGANLAIKLIFNILALVRKYLELSSINQEINSWLLFLWEIVIIPLAVVLVATNFALIYRFGVRDRNPKIPVLPGAILGSLCWLIACNIFRVYVTNFSHYNKVYGALGAAIVLMLWLYFNALSFLIGEQLNVVIYKVNINGQYSTR